MIRPLGRIFLILGSVVSLVPSARAQFAVATGTPPFGSFGGGPDVMNLGNNNGHLTIPVLHKPGRGQNFNMDITYDSSVWFPAGVSGSAIWNPVSSWGTSTWGWTGIFNNSMGYITFQETFVYAPCNPPNDLSQNSMSIYNNYTYVDQWGTAHTFSGAAPGSVSPRGGCTTLSPPPLPLISAANDGSGYTLSVSTAGTYVYTSDGASLNAPLNPAGPPQNWSKADRNGNIINGTSSGLYYDTLGYQVLTQNLVYTAPSGATAQFVGKYTTLPLQTNFGCSGVSELGTNGQLSESLLTEIDLPDYNSNTNPNSRYIITYEQTPGHSGFVTGRVSSITLPTGGSITYSYSGGNNGIICADGTAATLTRTVNDGTNSSTWIYARSQISGSHWQTTITDPAGNQTVIDFQKDSCTGSNCSPATYNFYETQRRTYQGTTGGTLLQTVNTCYNGASSPCTGTTVISPITQKSIITILPNNLQSKTTTLYDSHGNITEMDEYDFGSGAPPSTPLRKTITTYASLGNNINNMPSSVVVQDGSGNVKAKTTYAYDETAVQTTTGTPQHNSVSGSRGNATTIKVYKDTTNYLTTTSTYFDTGLVKTSTDVNGATTTFNYPDGTSTCGNAFPTSVSEPLGMSRSMTWNCTGGVQLTSVDENTQTTTTAYTDPYFWRPAQQNFPDGGQTSWAYNNQTSLTTTTKMSASQNIVSTVLLDGLGRTSQTKLNSDPQGVDYSVMTYDALGRPYQIYNPTRCSPPTTNCGEATWGYAAMAYDALGRPTQFTLQDGSVVGALYTNNTVTATDPASNVRQSTFDALGRLTQVLEDPGTSPHANFETDYGYDALGNLLCVGQKGTNSGTFSGCGSVPAGWRARTFAYDALSRLTSESNPENGTNTYKYDSDSNCASPNSSSGDLISRINARSIRTCLQYDALHRLTQKNYSDGITPTAFFLYDQNSRWGINLTNTTGRLVEEWTGTGCCATGGAEIFGYDAMGRVVYNNQYTVPAGNFALNYSFDLAGNLLTASDGVGITFSYGYDTAGRPTGVTSSYVDANHPATLATVDPSVGYYPSGAIAKITYGNSLTQATVIEPRLQPCVIDLNSSGSGPAIIGGCTGVSHLPSGTIQGFGYVHGSWGSADNGNVTVMGASGAQNFTRTYAYDQFNRLSTMSASDSCSGLSWTYDAWGNRTDQTVTSGTCNTFHASVNANNQLSGSPYQYDAAGNMTNDGNHTFFYDAENRLIQVGGTLGTCSTATACYFYDALGDRVDKQTGSSHGSYLHDLSGSTVTDYCAPCGGWTGNARDYIYLNGQQIAEYGNSTTYFIHPDHLGSTRLMTALNQSIYDNFDFLPFGEQIAGGTGSSHKFTGDERDNETNLDHTQFRQYSSQLGRWMHPDPAGLAAVDPSNPQSWNRYSYALNNPLNYKDTTGLYCYYGDTTPGSDDWLNGSQYDFSSSAGECAATDEYGNAGVWFDDTWNESVTVTADASPDPTGIGQRLSDWLDSFNSLDRGQISQQLNSCAAPLSQTKSWTTLSGGKIPEVLGSNSFGDVSALANRVGGLNQAAALSTEGAIEVAKEAGPMLAIGTVTGISKPISYASGVYNPLAVGTSAQLLGGKAIGKVGFGFLKAATLAKFVWDGAMYLAAEGACAAYAWRQ